MLILWLQSNSHNHCCQIRCKPAMLIP